MKSPSWGKTAFLAAILAALGLFAYWYEYQYKEEKEHIKEQAKKLFPIEQEAIAEIQLKSNHQTFVFHCLSLKTQLCKNQDPSRWEILSPRKEKADSKRVNQLLSAALGLTSYDVVSLEKDSRDSKKRLLKQYQLDQESLKKTKTLMLKTQKGDRFVAYFGIEHPVSSNVFSLTKKNGHIEKKRVFLVPKYFVGNFKKTFSYWRNKKLFQQKRNAVLSVHLSSRKGTVFLKRQAPHWKVNVGSGFVPASVSEVQSFLNHLIQLKAKKFLSEKNSKKKEVLKKAKKILKIQLNFSKTEPQNNQTKHLGVQDHYLRTLQIYTLKKGKQLLASFLNAPIVYEISKNQRFFFEKKKEDFRLSELLTSYERFNILRFQLEAPGLWQGRFEIKDKNGKWILTDTQRLNGKLFDPKKVPKLLGGLSGRKVEAFLKTQKTPKQYLKLSFWIRGEKEPKVFLFWKKKKQLFLKDLSQKLVQETLKINSQTIKVLPWKKDFFFKKINASSSQKKASQNHLPHS